MKVSKKSIFSFLFFILFLFLSCNSTKVESEKNTVAQAPSNDELQSNQSAQSITSVQPYKLEPGVKEKLAASKKELKEKYPENTKFKYLFIRLYDPCYENPFYPANMLKGGIVLIEVNNAGKLSHSAINFSLDDSFYGLTAGGKLQLAQESCETRLTNKYMRNCIPEKSFQHTYALLVPEEDYIKTKNAVEAYAKSTKIKYKVSKNVKIASFSIIRKVNMKKDEQQLGSCKFPKPKESKKPENGFVCSTFIAYVLKENVQSVNEFFKNNKINYEYFLVSDIACIPGVIELFSSPWNYYDESVDAFIKENPEFAEYYKPNLNSNEKGGEKNE